MGAFFSWAYCYLHRYLDSIELSCELELFASPLVLLLGIFVETFVLFTFFLSSLLEYQNRTAMLGSVVQKVGLADGAVCIVVMTCELLLLILVLSCVSMFLLAKIGKLRMAKG